MVSDSAITKTVNTPGNLQLPAPTASPVVLALGTTLLFAGLVTSASVSVLGAILFVVGAVSWFRDVLPHEALESVSISQGQPAIETDRREVDRLGAAHEIKRAWLPLEIYPVSAGIKGGLAGSVAMAALAMLYGLISQKSIWYPINLLVAGFFPEAVSATTAQIALFHPLALIIAVPSIWSHRLWWGSFTELCSQCFLAVRYCWEDYSRQSCGRAFYTPRSTSSTRC
jgi:hypothetical protein